MAISICPLCSSSQLSALLYRDSEAAITIAHLTPRPDVLSTATIELLQCKKCGYTFNSAFNREKTLPMYASGDYIVKSMIPGGMSNNMERIFREIKPFVNNKGKILEIGCGQADLALALGKEAQSVVTMDPSVQMHLENLPASVNHTHIKDYFRRDLVADHGPFDLIFFRHLLEHLPEPAAFLGDVSKITANGGVVYIEVPDWEHVMVHQRFCDIFNDHFGYFQKPTLDYVMSSLGFVLDKSIRTSSGHHMGLFFKKTAAGGYSPKAPKLYAEEDFKMFREQGDRLNGILDRGDRLAVWGAGAHGQSILSYISKPNRDKIKFYLDKDKNKKDKFIPNTNAKIVYPSTDVINNIDLILISAVLYADEITSELIHDLRFRRQIVNISNGVFISQA